MVAPIEPAQRHHFERHPDHKRGGERQQRSEDETVGPRRESRGEISPQHVQRAVGEIHQIHDAEDEREPGGEQKQQ